MCRFKQISSTNYPIEICDTLFYTHYMNLYKCSKNLVRHETDSAESHIPISLPSLYDLLLLKLHDGHLYRFRVSAFAELIITHLPWYHHSHISHPIQSSSPLYFSPQLPQNILTCSPFIATCDFLCQNKTKTTIFFLYMLTSIIICFYGTFSIFKPILNQSGETIIT